MKKQLIVILGALACAGSAWAKLPPPSDEAKQKADEAKAKAAHGDKIAAFQLCKVQDKLVARYSKAKAGASAACQDPGPFVAQTAAASAPAAPPAAAKPAAAAKK